MGCGSSKKAVETPATSEGATKTEDTTVIEVTVTEEANSATADTAVTEEPTVTAETTVDTVPEVPAVLTPQSYTLPPPDPSTGFSNLYGVLATFSCDSQSATEKGVELLLGEGRDQVGDVEEQVPGWLTMGMAEGEEEEKVYWLALFNSKDAYFTDHKKAQEKDSRKVFLGEIAQCAKNQNFMMSMAGSYMGPMICYETEKMSELRMSELRNSEKGGHNVIVLVKKIRFSESIEKTEEYRNQLIDKIPKVDWSSNSSESLSLLSIVITSDYSESEGPDKGVEDKKKEFSVVSIFNTSSSDNDNVDVDVSALYESSGLKALWDNEAVEEEGSEVVFMKKFCKGVYNVRK